VAALSRVISATASCIDIGAGIGAISLQLSKIAPKGHVHAFEPEPASFGYLTQNIAANDIVNITAYNLRISGGSEDPGLNRAWKPSGETIQCVSLDEWASKSNIPAVDFIRLDAEGMEPAILRGADELLRRERPDLAIEFVAQSGNDPGHDSAQRLYRMLKTYWEQIYLIPRNMSDQLVPINDFDHLVRLIEPGSGREYLFCTAGKRQGTRVHASAH
jgi:FkbM family methyltransferase